MTPSPTTNTMWTDNGAGGRGPRTNHLALRLWFKRVVVGGATNVDASDGPNPRAKAAPPPNSAVRHASRSNEGALCDEAHLLRLPVHSQ